MRSTEEETSLSDEDISGSKKEHKTFLSSTFKSSKLSKEEDCPKISESQVKDMMTNGNKTKPLPPSLLVTKGVNTFGSLLFKDLEKANNLVFSPFCISTVIAMLTPGAKGKTLEQVKIPFQIRNHPLKKD